MLVEPVIGKTFFQFIKCQLSRLSAFEDFFHYVWRAVGQLHPPTDVSVIDALRDGELVNRGRFP